MYKLKTALLQFNRAFMPVNLFVSLFLLWQLLKYPANVIIISQAIFLKAGIYLFIIGYQWYMQSKNWYYYRNAGMSIRRLFIYSCVLDIAVFLAVYALIYFMGKI